MNVYEIFRTDPIGDQPNEFQSAVVVAAGAEEAKQMVDDQPGVLSDLSNLDAYPISVDASRIVMISAAESW